MFNTSATFTTSTAKILILAQHASESQLLKQMLNKPSYKLTITTKLTEACQLAATLIPNLIILKGAMTVKERITAYHYLRITPGLENTPIVFIASTAKAEEKVAGLKLGAVDFITQPYTEAELILRINIYLQYSYISKNSGFIDSSLGVESNIKPSGYKENLSLSIFKAASAKMLSDLSASPNVKCLAKELRTNIKALNQAFKVYSQQTPYEFLRNQRMDYAKTLLRNSLYNITDISKLAGFKSPANFSTAFKQAFGCTPNQYRKHQPKL